MADSLDYIATELENKTGGDPSRLNQAVQDVLQKIMEEHESVIFNGDNYAEEWHTSTETCVQMRLGGGDTGRRARPFQS